MDRETRNQIQRATQEARVLLEREYAEQLEGTFDIRPDGTVGDAAGPHLDDAQRLVRSSLVTAVTHLRSDDRSKEEAVATYMREAAFTTLNRFVALKMLETRALVQECLSRGQQSSGFKEFVGLAPGLVQLPDHGYRLYIESLFDEIGREVRVLFDRRDPRQLVMAPTPCTAQPLKRPQCERTNVSLDRGRNHRLVLSIFQQRPGKAPHARRGPGATKQPRARRPQPVLYAQIRGPVP